MSVRDELRKATLGTKVEFRKKVVNYNGMDFEIRQPSVKARSELFKRCTDDKGKVDLMNFLTWSVIFNTYVPDDAKDADGNPSPDAGKLVYEEGDYATLVEKPAGGFMDQFGEIASELMNVNEDSVGKK